MTYFIYSHSIKKVLDIGWVGSDLDTLWKATYPSVQPTSLQHVTLEVANSINSTPTLQILFFFPMIYLQNFNQLWDKRGVESSQWSPIS